MRRRQKEKRTKKKSPLVSRPKKRRQRGSRGKARQLTIAEEIWRQDLLAGRIRLDTYGVDYFC